MNLKREMIAVKERLDKIEGAIAGLLLSPPPPVTAVKDKTVKKVVAKKKTVKKADPKAVKTTSEQIAQVEM